MAMAEALVVIMVASDSIIMEAMVVALACIPGSLHLHLPWLLASYRHHHHCQLQWLHLCLLESQPRPFKWELEVRQSCKVV